MKTEEFAMYPAGCLYRTEYGLIPGLCWMTMNSWCVSRENFTCKDFIAPSSFRFGDGRMFQMGGKFGAVSFLQIAAPELSDRMLADFMDADNGIVVNLHIQSIDHNEAIKTIKRKINDLDRRKIEEQKKAIRSGYDMDIIPVSYTHLDVYKRQAVTRGKSCKNHPGRQHLAAHG